MRDLLVLYYSAEAECITKVTFVKFLEIRVTSFAELTQSYSPVIVNALLSSSVYNQKSNT